jgi:(p)ppGpp synthase/HD superfamily hydrolase
MAMEKKLMVLSMLDAAIRLAVAHHAGQQDKGGRAYILHPLRVMNAVRDLGEEAMAAAVLHDIVEDTSVTLDDLRAMAFPESVVRAVDLLTRPPAGAPDRPTYRAFVERIRESGDPIARAVKLADLRDNLGRIGELPATERGIARRYEEAIRTLEG